MKMLLDKGADVNARRNDGQTALISAAASYGQADVMRVLLDRGANIKARDKNGNTALISAACSLSGNKVDVVRLLLERGANIEDKNNNGQTALDLATSWNLTDIVKLLQQALSDGSRPKNTTSSQSSNDLP